MADDTVTVTIETPDNRDEIEVVPEAIDVLNESDEGMPTVIGDLAMLGVAQQLHAVLHHAQGDIGVEESDANEQAMERTMELFEERFGQPFEEMMGHGH
ncbi:uncharacterized protein NP_2568A [Natronomonas pharaonis DSM 2160]|uniref:Uncharacterized protein n=1 Tax=Natronomonas pharaonis (strain ATCC 35678 / DSM 2160 / CIP 103997 / JCM 8858 / NBRC 14720 / NCIMB 2260 / Gabara) TaxID=348780 RepID=A0A1U7EWB3_NATPD|nr:hypothetical protein [Natronomonas pharaonis]CAI49375.1 uncharacterized protein NP_2568A [Natronomonas pharaonis DSM 2160]